MTDREKSAVFLHRKWRDEAAVDLAQSVLAGEPSAYHAREVMRHTQKIAEIVSDAHCGDCGAHESEECSPTCGWDGPTASDAMADGAAHAE